MAVKSTEPVVLLGPQTDFTEIGQVLDELEVDGPVALITTGWQENESEDEALVAKIARPTTNLALHARSETFFHEDLDYAAAYAARQQRLRHMQHFYRIRLDAIDDARRSVAVRQMEPELQEEELSTSIGQLRHLDDDHVARCREIWREFDTEWPAQERPALRRQREEIAELLSPAKALVISGGHVAVLLNRLRLFDVLAGEVSVPIVAWSAGAMSLADRIVLFHDTPPFGKNLAQVLDVGLGLAPGVVVMPDVKHRVQTDEVDGIERFTKRMAPALCMGMDPGARLVFERGKLVSGVADRLCADGTVQAGWRP